MKKYFTADNAGEYFFILDKIQIKKEFRNKGIASAILKNPPSIIMNEFDLYGFGLSIFLRVGAFEIPKFENNKKSEKFEKESKKLVEFYEQFGYREIKSKINSMATPIAATIPTINFAHTE